MLCKFIVLHTGPSDTTRPTVTITSTASTITAAAFTVTVTFSEAVVGFDATKITVVNGSAGAVAGTGPYTSVITPTATGTVTVQVEANKVTDAAGNNNTASNTFSILYVAASVWFDFSDITTLYQTNDTSTPVTADGQSIGYVADKSGNARHATQATGANKPVYKASIKNSLSVGRLDGLKTLSTAVLAPTVCLGADGSNTTFIVLDADLCNGDIRQIGTSRYFISPEQSGNIYNDCGDNSGARLTAASTAFRDWSIWTSYRNANTKMEILDNATSIAEKTAGISGGTPSGNAAIIIGSTLIADLAEILIFNSYLSDAQRSAISSYLNTKWAVF